MHSACVSAAARVVWERAHTGEIWQACYDGYKIAFDLGNKISKSILAQIIACLSAPPQLWTGAWFEC